MNYPTTQTDYLWCLAEISSMRILGDAMGNQPVGMNSPPGYRLHSWQPNPYSNGTVIICWIRDSSTSSALSQIPVEWAAPVLEWVKRIVLK